MALFCNKIFFCHIIFRELVKITIYQKVFMFILIQGSRYKLLTLCQVLIKLFAKSKILMQQEILPSKSNQSQYRQQQDSGLTVEQEAIKDKFMVKERYLQPNSLFSKIFFTWISSLLAYGKKVSVSQQSIPSLAPPDKPKIQFEKLYQNFIQAPRSNREGLTLLKVIFKTFRRQFLFLFLVASLYTVMQIGQPILTNHIIKYVQGEGRNASTGLIYFITVFIVTFSMSLLMSQIYYVFAILGYNLSNTLSLMIYHKTMKHPLITEKQFGVSKIINYSQVDAQRLTSLGFQLVSLLLTPIQLIVMLFLLYQYIGIVFLVGIGVMACLMVFTLFFSKMAAKANDELLKKKDARMKVAEEILQIIKYIKVNALEKYFFRRLNKKREEELTQIRKVQMYTISTIFIYWICPNLIVASTFFIYTLNGQDITPQVAFTVILLFSILQDPIRLLPTAISEILQIWSSLKRIEHYLMSLQRANKSVKNYEYNGQKFCIQIENGNFLWGAEKDKEGGELKKMKKKESDISTNQDLLKESLISDSQEEQVQKKEDYIHVLKNINLKFKTGETVMIVGDIGSGKSSLLYAMLNQMTEHQTLTPSIKIYGSISFCPQKPWIMSSTVKQNILFYKKYNEEKFKEALRYSCLECDIKTLSKGLDTQIGEKGANLSGGQKARISLARAIYSDSDIYLLDDVLSAVDVHVGKFLMQKTINTYLKGKTIILPTHAINFADRADRIIIMKNGRIIREGSYQQINKSPEFEEIKKLQEMKKEKQGQQHHKEEDEVIYQQKMVCNATKLVNSWKNTEEKVQTVTEKVIESLIIPEDKSRGSVNIKIYRAYIKLNGGWKFLVLVLGCISLWALLSTLSNIQIQHWCEDYNKSVSHIYLYLGLAVAGTFFSSARAFILVSSGLKQGRKLHKKVMKSLLYASIIKFYNRVPIGRILNRLSKDLRQIDETIGNSVGGLLVNSFKLFSGFAMCLYASTPFIAIPGVIIFYLCSRLTQYYLTTQRQVVRLENISSSPIVSGFISAINGAATIRSYGAEQDFFNQQAEKIDRNKRNRITREALQSWFSMRLSMLSFIINMGAIAYCIISDNGNGSLAGLLLAYSLSINQDLVNTIFSYASMETRMISIERIMNFTQIEPEQGYLDYCKEWWTKEEGFQSDAIPRGRITFENYSLKYREDLPVVLHNIDLIIEPGQKIGIAGRTGAGKSTLLSSLLRIVEGHSGHLKIDNHNIQQIHLKDLRSSITMIDQEPILIQGSFRENIDPTNKYTTQELQNILVQCNLWQMVQEKGGLEIKATNDNLSVGQRQLLCICRAFLKKSKIVLIDEATANIDVKNDQKIQQIIATKFKKSTVLTVAHRLSTIKNSDKILILNQGKVIQWGETDKLLRDKDSIFSKMINENDHSFLQ